MIYDKWKMDQVNKSEHLQLLIILYYISLTIDPIFFNKITKLRTLSDYKAQIISMIQNNKSTIYVNFNHIQDIDHELAEAIELEYYRFEPFLRQAVQDIVAAENKDYFFDVDRGQRFVEYNYTIIYEGIRLNWFW